MRFLAQAAIALGALTLPAGAQGLPTLHTTFLVKVEEHGNFAGRYLPELPTQAVVAALETGCIAFGVECSAVAESLVGAAKQTVFKRAESDINHTLGVFPPPGYDTCRARANISFASISGGSTFNATIHNADNGGDPNGPYYLGILVVVPHTDKGENVTSEVAVEYVPIGTRALHACWAAENPPLWTCKGQDCKFRDGAHGGWTSGQRQF